MSKHNFVRANSKDVSKNSPTVFLSSSKRYWKRFASSWVNIAAVVVLSILVLFFVFSFIFYTKSGSNPINNAYALNTELPSSLSPWKTIILPYGEEFKVYQNLQNANNDAVIIQEIIDGNDGLKTYIVRFNAYLIFNSTSTHLLGTNSQGIDIFARVLSVYKSSFAIVFASSIIALILGVLTGVLFALFINKKISKFIEKTLTTFALIPYLLISIVLYLFVEFNVLNSILIFSLLSFLIFLISSYQKSVDLLQQEFILAEVSLGYSKWNLATKSLFKPVLLHSLIQINEHISLMLISLAALSIFDINLTSLTLGTIIKEALNLFNTNSAYFWFILLTLTLIIFSLKTISFGLNNAYINIKGEYE
ncbi:ABC transporter permease subunit [Mycoplasma simbae]|uniref:ABC transporter permease subunit n=1 Tax=Mycoplasma simbae TaxID=36744 RepID=UPI000495874C|nr:ABC transporter permease subunit [Mycoplasma simbae]